MTTCTTRTLEGMYIFSNPPKAVAAPVSLKQIGKPLNYKNYRTSTIANNYRSIYSPNHFITGRPLSGYWWREKKETYEQRMNATPIGPTDRPTEDDRLGLVVSVTEKSLQDAICQTDILKEKETGIAISVVHSACQTTAAEKDFPIGQQEIHENRINNTKILKEIEVTRKEQEAETAPLEIVSRLLSRSYIEDMMPKLINIFKECGIPDTFHNSEKGDNAVLPWLMNELELGLSRLEASYKLLNESTVP